MKSINQIIVGLESVAEHAEVMSKTPGWSAMAGTYREEASLLREAVAKLRTHQDAQPNEPLTLEELREMADQPVWVENIYPDDTGWAIVAVRSDGDVELHRPNGQEWLLTDDDDDDYDPDEDEIKAVYRRPPKEEQL